MSQKIDENTPQTNPNEAALEERDNVEAEEFTYTIQNPPLNPVTPPPFVNQNKKKKDYSYWSHFLFQKPSFERVTQFIFSYQSGEISSSLFYKILKEMFKKPQPFKNFSVKAIGSIPSPQSFLFFAEVHQRADSLQLEDLIKKHMEVYSQTKNLIYLQQVVSITSSPEVSAMALELINKSMSSYIDLAESNTLSQQQAAQYKTSLRALLRNIENLENKNLYLSSLNENLIAQIIETSL